jgi:hypothetical protein
VYSVVPSPTGQREKKAMTDLEYGVSLGRHLSCYDDESQINVSLNVCSWTMRPLDVTGLRRCIPWAICPLENTSPNNVSRPQLQQRHWDRSQLRCASSMAPSITLKAPLLAVTACSVPAAPCPNSSPFSGTVIL